MIRCPFTASCPGDTRRIKSTSCCSLVVCLCSHRRLPCHDAEANEQAEQAASSPQSAMLPAFSHVISRATQNHKPPPVGQATSSQQPTLLPTDDDIARLATQTLNVPHEFTRMDLQSGDVSHMESRPQPIETGSRNAGISRSCQQTTPSVLNHEINSSPAQDQPTTAACRSTTDQILSRPVPLGPGPADDSNQRAPGNQAHAGKSTSTRSICLHKQTQISPEFGPQPKMTSPPRDSNRACSTPPTGHVGNAADVQMPMVSQMDQAAAADSVPASGSTPIRHVGTSANVQMRMICQMNKAAADSVPASGSTPIGHVGTSANVQMPMICQKDKAAADSVPASGRTPFQHVGHSADVQMPMVSQMDKAAADSGPASGNTPIRQEGCISQISSDKTGSKIRQRGRAAESLSRVSNAPGQEGASSVKVTGMISQKGRAPGSHPQNTGTIVISQKGRAPGSRSQNTGTRQVNTKGRAPGPPSQNTEGSETDRGSGGSNGTRDMLLGLHGRADSTTLPSSQDTTAKSTRGEPPDDSRELGQKLARR